MSVKKSIAIVGATEENGQEIVMRLINSNYPLLLISNDKNELSSLEKRIANKKPKAEISFLECVKDGCWEADIIILSVPSHDKQEVAKLMKEVATQKIVVDVSGEEKREDELKGILPYSKLVRVSGDFSSGEITISGDDAAVNKEISDFFIQTGYRTTAFNNSFDNK